MRRTASRRCNELRSRRRRLQLDRIAVGILDVDRGAVALGAVALHRLAGIDAVPREMGAQRRLVESCETQAEMVEVATLDSRPRAALAAELAVER